MREVTPCRMKLCALPSFRMEKSEWLWMSIKPGATTSSDASIVRLAVLPVRRPMAAILPCLMPMSPICDGFPVPSTTFPPRIRRSKSCAASTETRLRPKPSESRDRFIGNIVPLSSRRCPAHRDHGDVVGSRRAGGEGEHFGGYRAEDTMGGQHRGFAQRLHQPLLGEIVEVRCSL